MYTVIGATNNRTIRVIWMLEELDQPYTRVLAKSHTPEVTAQSTLGKIPVLLDGADAITDSAAILTYLADKHGQFTAPPGTVARGQQDAIMHQVLDDLEGVIWTATRHMFIVPEEHRIPELRPQLKWEFGRNAQALADRMQGEYLTGDTPTVPDFLAAHTLRWAMGAKFPIESDRLRAFAQRMFDRPAFQRALESERTSAG
ncbi:glutathione S-transferase family protein [Pseudooceanicola aestuarii]|uniref:glutathione S-transferase family protein n=1 Tax=Pseudooceanicola aestuarii TaxID=2697319 RepID=UPI0013D8C174|nr:glutathione S-transferase family protein [Pseudooceanicola aestuarii]